MTNALILAALSAMFLGSCGGSVNTQPPGGADGGPTGSEATDLTGTWDVVGVVPGHAPTTGTITIAKDRLEVLFLPHPSVTYTANGDHVTALFSKGGPLPITTQHVARVFDMGVIPLGVGGDWVFAEPQGGGQCDVAVGTTLHKATCVNVGWRSTVGIDPPVTHVTYSLARLSALPSRFGDLGGEWRGTDNNGGTGTCTLRFEGSKVSGGCQHVSNPINAGFVITFGDGKASGQTDTGAEFTAQKR